MASSQLFPRLFTVDEANDLLPALRPLMKRIFDHLDFLRNKSEAVIRKERLSPNSPVLMERLQENNAIARLIQEVKGLVEEINSYGCVCKGAEQGLVDFPCVLGGEIVFLCWRYGEESIGHWHRIEDGFAGRRPLLDADEDGGSGNVSYH
ncbi:MAG: DUF2203 domain-containing protein [Deltaproteobacteria bacterium]|nr:DUF2203 domain-containing protein [Deltaproteobacteria bacterium]